MNNALCCDRCGRTVNIPIVEGIRHLPRKEMEHVIQTMFFATKRIFGEQGWFTSVGYDLCPTCCKDTGTPSGYSENGLLPDTIAIPRNPPS